MGPAGATSVAQIAANGALLNPNGEAHGRQNRENTHHDQHLGDNLISLKGDLHA